MISSGARGRTQLGYGAGAAKWGQDSEMRSGLTGAKWGQV